MNELECSAGGRAGERENTCSVIPFIDKQHQRQQQQQQHHHPYRSKEWRVSERNILYTGRLVGSLASRLLGGLYTPLPELAGCLPRRILCQSVQFSLLVPVVE